MRRSFWGHDESTPTKEESIFLEYSRKARIPEALMGFTGRIVG